MLSHHYIECVLYDAVKIEIMYIGMLSTYLRTEWI